MFAFLIFISSFPRRSIQTDQTLLEIVVVGGEKERGGEVT